MFSNQVFTFIAEGVVDIYIYHKLPYASRNRCSWLYFYLTPYLTPTQFKEQANDKVRNYHIEHKCCSDSPQNKEQGFFMDKSTTYIY